MRPIFSRRLVATVAAAAVVSMLTLTGATAQAALRTAAVAGSTDLCPQVSSSDAGCAVEISTPDDTAARNAAAATTPQGLSPDNLQQAYQLQSATAGVDQTVAVVTAYDDPDLASDLAAYRTQYGLTACTVADGCLRQVSETGTSTLPGTYASWDVAESESVDMISAICPNCHILVVEAGSATMSDLGPAENEAVTLGAKFVDNDWFIDESPSETTYDTEYFDHPGVAMTAPGDDQGYGDTTYPAASPDVIAAGGTAC